MSPDPDAGVAEAAAVIDIGSNSVLLLTVEIGRDGRTRALDEALATPRLGTGLRPGGRLDPGALARTRDAVVGLAARARARGARRPWAFATAAARDAVDGPAAAREIGAAAGVPLEVLTGEREAALAYAAVSGAVATAGFPLLVADVGGRTTELTLGVGARVLASASLPLGALALSEAHASDLEGAGAAVDAVLGACDVLAGARAAGARLAASGGTATALAALDLGLVAYVPRRVHGHQLGALALAARVGALARMTGAERSALAGIDPGRGAILLPGALVLQRIAAALGSAHVVVSDHAVRHAYLREKLAAHGRSVDLSELWP